MTHSPTPPPITVFGRTTCEDTAIIRDRLQRLGVPFSDIDLDRDPGAARLVEELNHGHQVTPTVLFGGTDTAVAEPTLDALDERLVDDGWPIHRPEPAQFHGDLVAMPLPLLTLVDAMGAAFPLGQFRGRRQLTVFFAHDAQCRVCAGYARQLAAVRPKLADGDARALVVVPGGTEEVQHWLAEFTDKVTVVADRESRWKKAVAVHVELDADGAGAMLLALDRYLAPRIGSIAADAGGLITPGQAAEWLEFASLEVAGRATEISGMNDSDG